MESGEILWRPSAEELDGSHLAAFGRRVAARAGGGAATGADDDPYERLHRWSVENPHMFWNTLLEDELDFPRQVRTADKKERVAYVDEAEDKEKPSLVRKRWFPNVEANAAKVLLAGRSFASQKDRPAIVAYGEHLGSRVDLSWDELDRQSAALQHHLLERVQIRSGESVAALLPNRIEAVVALLSSAACGATWSSCSPELGATAVLDRLRQTKPCVLFVVSEYSYKSKRIDVTPLLAAVLPSLPRIRHVIVVDGGGIEHLSAALPSRPAAPSFASFADATRAHAAAPRRLHFQHVRSDHPLYIMFSSGTTGVPKCIVQGWGVLLNQLKELRLHLEVDGRHVLLFYTSLGWMMWNWSLACLALGCTLVLFDGAPLPPHDPAILLRIARRERVSHLGVSAAYVGALEQLGVDVRRVLYGGGGASEPVSRVKTLMVTGSPSSPANFRFVAEHFGAAVRYVSISGGTDINGCFALGCALRPVRCGELQCVALGADVRVWRDDGSAARAGERGELVCCNALPAMPLCFLGDAPHHRRYFEAYFERFGARVWCHGDFVEITPHRGMIIHGRSDATMNPGGVRMGSAEVYRALELVDGVEDALVVAQRWRGDERLLLLVVLRGGGGGARLSDALRAEIRAVLRRELSPRHVPAVIVEVPDVPYTFNGKKAEVAARRVVNGDGVNNRSALRNPECLDALESLRHEWERPAARSSL